MPGTDIEASSLGLDSCSSQPTSPANIPAPIGQLCRYTKGDQVCLTYGAHCNLTLLGAGPSCGGSWHATCMATLPWPRISQQTWVLQPAVQCCVWDLLWSAWPVKEEERYTTAQDMLFKIVQLPAVLSAGLQSPQALNSPCIAEHYGFCLADNPHDRAWLPAAIFTVPALQAALKPSQCWLHSCGTPSWQLLCQLRVGTATPAEQR